MCTLDYLNVYFNFHPEKPTSVACPLVQTSYFQSLLHETSPAVYTDGKDRILKCSFQGKKPFVTSKHVLSDMREELASCVFGMEYEIASELAVQNFKLEVHYKRFLVNPIL